MLSLFNEQPDHSQIFSIPFDSTPAVFDSKVSVICQMNDYTNFFYQPTSSSMFCSRAPFSLLERTCNKYLEMESDLHGHCRTTIEPGIVGTAINGTIRLQSDFEVRYSTLINSYIYIILISLAAGSRSTNSMHLAILRPWVIILFMPFKVFMIIWTNGFPVNHTTMNNAFGAAFFKMGLLGQAHNPNVSNRWYFITKLSSPLTTSRTVDWLQFRHPFTPVSQRYHSVPSRPIPRRHWSIGKLTVALVFLIGLATSHTNDLVC